MRITCLAVLFSLFINAYAAELPEGVRRVKVLNYVDCFELSNADTRVTLCHQIGGRVLEYSFKGKNALYLDPEEARWGTPGGPRAPDSAGRFDIGPEYLIPERPKLWSGEWQAEAIGPRAVRLTSQADESTGVQLVREFRLDPKSTHLACTQIIRNVSPETKHWAYWSRTFAVHGGIGVVPLTPETQRFPNGFVMYDQGTEPSILLRPTDPNVRRRGKFLEVLGPTRAPKLGFASNAGWFGYVVPRELALLKRYHSEPDGIYPANSSLPLCCWSPQANQIPACEWEPHGPRNNIPPGGSASFTEDWFLLPYVFPAAGAQIDLDALAARVDREAR